MSSPKVVSTLLYTEGSQKVNEEVAKELKVPDPDEAAAQATIHEHQRDTNGKTS